MLTVRQQLLASIAERWGGIDVSTFDRRLLLQKRIFLITMLGIDLGYQYSWYLKGPYSPGLTKDAFAVAEKEQQSPQFSVSVNPPKHLIERVDEIQATFGEEWNDPIKMELYASVIFLLKRIRLTDRKLIAERLHQLKGLFSEREASDAVDYLLSKGVVR